MFKKVRSWLKPGAEDAEAIAEAKRAEDDKLTIRVSQMGRQPYMNIPPLRTCSTPNATAASES